MKIHPRPSVAMFVATALTVATVAGCATQPQPLQGEYNPVTPQMAVDATMTGAPVRWGGRVIQVEPKENRTCFEMLSTSLNSNARPYWASDDTGGRFIACRNGFYDPAVFESGREVTFTGRIAGFEERQVGGYNYRFPMVEADVVYLWPIREQVDVINYPAPWPWWGWW